MAHVWRSAQAIDAMEANDPQYRPEYNMSNEMTQLYNDREYRPVHKQKAQLYYSTYNEESLHDYSCKAYQKYDTLTNHR